MPLRALRVVPVEKVPPLVRVRPRVFRRALHREIDRLHRLLLPPEPHQRHRAEIRALHILGIEREPPLRGRERRLPVAQAEPDARQHREMRLVLRIEPDRLLDRRQRRLPAIEPVQHHREDVMAERIGGRQCDRALRGLQRTGVFLLIDAAQREVRMPARRIGILGGREHGFAFGVGGTRLLQQQLRTIEAMTHLDIFRCARMSSYRPLWFA